MSALPPHAASRYLARQLLVQTETLTRKGFSPEVVSRQRNQLEAAIRAESGRMIATGVA